MGLAVVTVASGGLPVVESTIGGTPVTEAANGRGVPVTKVVGKPGLPVVFETIGVVAPVTYTTWNPADRSGSNMALTNGNLTATATTGGSGVEGVRGVVGVTSGKYYVEYRMSNWLGSATGVGIGLGTAAFSGGITLAGIAGVNKNGGIFINGSSQSGVLGGRATNDVIGLAVDLGASLIWFRVAPSGNWNGSGTANPATGIGGLSIASISTGSLYPFLATQAQNAACIADYGASAFVGAVPAGFTSGWPA